MTRKQMVIRVMETESAGLMTHLIADLQHLYVCHINRLLPRRIWRIWDIFNLKKVLKIDNFREFSGLKRFFLVIVTIVTLRQYSVKFKRF